MTHAPIFGATIGDLDLRSLRSYAEELAGKCEALEEERDDLENRLEDLEGVEESCHDAREDAQRRLGDFELLLRACGITERDFELARAGIEIGDVKFRAMRNEG